MAGSPKKREERELLTKQIDDLEAELAALKRKVATHAPYLLDQSDKEAERFGSVTAENADDLCQRIEAMATQGMMESQMIAALGMTLKQWNEGKVGFPNVADALARARVKAVAHYESLLNRAIENDNNRVPLHAIRAAIETVTKYDTGNDDSAGDGSSLVRVAS